MRDLANIAELKTRLGEAAAMGGKVNTNAIDKKFFRRNETYAGVIGTWQEAAAMGGKANTNAIDEKFFRRNET